ncbi:hypothetical protein GCM10011611_36210 [Aliidongia dinghuensis]|uniref:Choice-of-anchor D domain-containing protein n=1 Tax=Aliidongia dinghuensis TaxID=1867774 RepID=A0A8J2YWR5_9PROT|nr:hypothetical protein [Aliidongia dinghuensis]GGF26949.1 hypothetical protein GCM10011611_36210 [Aliidongia dinghuensis]
MRIFVATFIVLASLIFAPFALAKGSCCYHPPARVYVTGPTSFPGVVQPGQTATLNVGIVVSGGALTSVSVAPGGAFTLVSTDCSTAARTQCTAVVAFKPALGGNYSGAITGYAVGPYGKGNATAALSGAGYGENYAWDPPLSLSVAAGTRGSVQLALHSTGQTPLIVTSVNLSQAGAYLALGPNGCVAKPIAPGASCLVTIDYDASVVESEATSYPMYGTLSVVTPATATSAHGTVDITAIVPQGEGD